MAVGSQERKKKKKVRNKFNPWVEEKGSEVILGFCAIDFWRLQLISFFYGNWLCLDVISWVKCVRLGMEKVTNLYLKFSKVVGSRSLWGFFFFWRLDLSTSHKVCEQYEELLINLNFVSLIASYLSTRTANNNKVIAEQTWQYSKSYAFNKSFS